jgi:hypothetical protein
MDGYALKVNLSGRYRFRDDCLAKKDALVAGDEGKGSVLSPNGRLIDQTRNAVR